MADLIQMYNATLNGGTTQYKPLVSQRYWESRGWVPVPPGVNAPAPYDAKLDAQVADLLRSSSSQTVPALATAVGTNFARPGDGRGSGYVALGDSISTAELLGAGGAGYGSAWGHMVCALSGQRLLYVGNAGVSGNNSTQVLARTDAVVALKPQVVSLLVGTNDLTGSVTFATWSANIKAIVGKLRAAGIRVVLCTIPPRGNTTYLATQLRWNAWLTAYARSNGHDLVDFFRLLVDPTTSMYRSGYDCGDGVHPSAAAHIVMAQHFASVVTSSAYSPLQALISTDANNLVANPLLTAGTTTPSSWIPGGTTMTGYTEQLVTDSDFDGRAWEIDFNLPSNAAGFRQFSSFQLSSSAWSAGETLLFCARAKITDATGITPGANIGLRYLQTFTGGTPGSYVPIGGDAVVHGTGLWWFTRTIPAGTTAIQSGVIVGLVPTTGRLRARVGNFGVYNLSRLGLLTP